VIDEHGRTGSRGPASRVGSAQVLSRDRRRLYAAAFVRSSVTGMVAVLLGLHLLRLGLDTFQVGLVVGTGLGGAALASLFATYRADAFGRRRLLVVLASLAAAALLGMLNGMGRDRGAALVVEQAALPSTTTDAGRTRSFAVYNVIQDVGHALGSLLAAIPAVLQRTTSLNEHASLRLALILAAIALLAAVPAYLGLSAAVEAAATARHEISRQSRRVLARICALFAVDSLGGGLLSAAMLSVFFHQRFGVGEVTLGALFFGARVLNALSHLAAAWLARRIGLVNTMVFTHIPSSLLLASVAFAPTFPVAAALFLAREGLVEMDVPTRQSYVMGVVRPEERSFASGVTHLVRLGAWAAGPVLAGYVMEEVSLWVPLVSAAALKISYDLALFTAFRRLRPPEERTQ
jgi:MFS family permease